MKDLPHHIKKLNRQVVRSEHRDEMEEEAYSGEVLKAPAQEQTPRQVKKQAKQRKAKENASRVHNALTPEEKNKKMAKRVPNIESNKAKTPTTRPTRKKTPRI